MPRSRRPLVLALLALAVAVLVVDQLTKVWAVQSLTEGVRTPLVGDLLGLTLLYNPGAALSIATGMTWVLTLAAATVSVVILRVANRLGSRGWAVGLGLLLGGALGILVDRLFREPGFARGHVVDFIAYGELFVGNVADIAIVAAAGLIVLLSLRGIGVDGTREEPSGAGAPDARVDADAAAAEPADGSAPSAQERARTPTSAPPEAAASSPGAQDRSGVRAEDL